MKPTKLKVARTLADGATQEEALKIKGFANLREMNYAIRHDYETVSAALPCWTTTHLRYKAGSKEAEIWNEGEKPVKIHLPLQDGYYLPDKKYGIPNGKKVTEGNPDALYLCHWQDRDWEGLVSRGVGYGRRYVGCVYGPGLRLGVLRVVGKKSPKHKHVWKCACGATRGD